MVGVKIAENRFSQVFRFFPYLLAGTHHNSLSRMSHARQESVTRAINPARWTSNELVQFKLVLPLSHSAHLSHHCLLRVVSVHARSSNPLGMQHWTRWVGWVASEGTRGERTSPLQCGLFFKFAIFSINVIVGDVAQMAERFVSNEEATGSMPVFSNFFVCCCGMPDAVVFVFCCVC